MSRSSAIGAVVVACASLLSCTLLVDLDGLVSGGGDGGGGDATPEASSSDGGPDADAGDDAALPDPCAAPGVLYCTRFDGPTALAAFRNETDDSTRIEVLTSTFFSAPAAAAFTVERSNNQSADATLGITLGSNVSRVSFRGRVRIEKREAVAGRLLAMRIGNGGTILLDHAGDVHQSGVAKLGAVPAVVDDTWVAIRMELDGSASPPTASVTIGDAPTATFAITTGSWSPGEVAVVFGISETSTPTDGWLVRWDDVVIQSL